MAEYIDRSEIKCEMWAVGPLCSPMMIVRKKTIDSIPAADVAPVVHGEWRAKIMKDIGTHTVYWCSKCNCCSYFRYKYCPNCGAKMDGDS